MDSEELSMMGKLSSGRGARRHEQFRQVDLGVWCWPVLLVVVAFILLAVVTV